MYSMSCEVTHIAHLVKFVIKVLIIWLCPNGGKPCVSTFLYRYFGRKAERRIMAQVYVIGRVAADFEKRSARTKIHTCVLTWLRTSEIRKNEGRNIFKSAQWAGMQNV